MPIYDITHYLPIETLPPPETNKTYYTKPVLVLIVSLRVNTWNKYLSLIRKLQREARLLCVTNVYDLNELVDEHADEIAGFIVTTGDIMLADEHAPVLPRHNSNNPTPNLSSNSHSNEIETKEGMIEGLPTRLSTLLKHHTYSLIFAFEFPRAAAKYPTSFTAFMQAHFGVSWTIAGTSRQRVAMELQPHIPGMLAARNYRRWFHIRGVFLRGVPRQEKVLVSCEDGEVEFGEGERMNRWTLWHRRPWIETPDTVVGEWDEIQSEGRLLVTRRDIWVVARRWMKMTTKMMKMEMERMRTKSFVLTALLPSTKSKPRTKLKLRPEKEATSPLSVTWRTAARWPR
jgi:hypothetical protein